MDIPNDFESIVEPVREDMPTVEDAEQDQALDMVGKQAELSAAYWLTLSNAGLPIKSCDKLTLEWMNLCAWSE